jgi:Zn-dependent protease with chaperone function
MLTCPSCSGKLEEKLTKAGVFVDICSQCSGYWLDQGEFNFFCKSRKLLFEYNKSGLSSKKLTKRSCPKCADSRLFEGKLPVFGQTVDECPKCEGLHFSRDELVKLNNSKYVKGLLEASFKKSHAGSLKKTWLPSLGLTSVFTLTLMYAVLVGFVVLLIELEILKANIGLPFLVGFVLIQFLLGPIIFDWSLRLFGSLEWVSLDELPKQFAEDLIKICKENKLGIPKFGIIEDGSPQAFTYGRTTRDARVIFSKGMFDILNEEELKAVLAHELGHIKHWDFAIMCLAQLVPLLFYHIYRFFKNVGSNKNRKKDGGYAILVAFVAYVFYIITEYLVLFISRLREYHADRFSSKTTKNPNALITALAKIGIGIAVNAHHNDETSKKDLDRKKAVQAMGIMNVAGSKSLVLSSANGEVEEFGSENLKEVMKWDLWNPWSGFYELQSTHPLISKRINALSQEAIRMGEEPYVIFDHKKNYSYWDDFFKDLFILSLPILMGFASLLLNFKLVLLFSKDNLTWIISLYFLLGYSLGGLIRLQFIYPSGAFLKASIVGLLKKINVSPVTSYPIKLKGKVIGRGESGYIFSEDMVLKDQTGLIYLNHEPFGFNLFFALKSFHEFEGEDVEVTGWYRRSPNPYIEVKKITSKDSTSSSYTKLYKEILYLLLLIGVVYLIKYIGLPLIL